MARFTISKRFEFSASHQLAGLPEGHQCARLHGHNYVVELELNADQLDDTGFVLDYGELAPFKRWIDDVLDHRHLNEIMAHNSTAENLAQWLYSVAAAVVPGIGGRVAISAVRVMETPKTVAEFRP
jgi:6-pyruvoyltetrahydropterin/6-carboxytetrahydropterin synthase